MDDSIEGGLALVGAKESRTSRLDAQLAELIDLVWAL